MTSFPVPFCPCISISASVGATFSIDFFITVIALELPIIGSCRFIADTSDRRARLIKLTPQGRRLWTSLQPKIYEFYRQAMLQFRFDDSIAFVHYLNRLQADLLEVKLP